MNRLPASAGWRWVKDGFALFRKRPGQFMMLFSAYLFVMIGLGLIPVIGQLLPMFMAPTFSMVFLTACAQINRNGQLDAMQLRASFAPPVATRLIILGCLYVGAALLAVAASTLIDGGLFLKLMMGQRDMEATPAQRASVLGTLVLLAVLYIPIFWYAAPLIVWRKMPVFQAMFYSFFTVIHNVLVFIVYLLSWILVGALVPSFLVGLLTMVIGKGIAMLLMFLLTMVMTVVMYCSFYPSYTDVFGEPDLPSPDRDERL